MNTRIKSIFELFKDAGSGVANDRVAMMGAALAYYTMFSIAPLLVIALGVVGMVFGEKGDAQIFSAIGGLMGENGAMTIRGMVRGAVENPREGMIAALIGCVTLVLGASGVFLQLQESLNIIWKVVKKPGAGVWPIVRRRLLSFAMVGVIAFMLLVSLLASAGISAASHAVGVLLPGGTLLWKAVNVVISIAVIAMLFALIFKVLPDVSITWRESFFGGVFTSLLFAIGKSAVAAYLGHSGVASTYGAAGSLIVVLLWVYYNSQLVLFGAEFTRAYAARGGKAIVPRRGAAAAAPVAASKPARRRHAALSP